MATAGLAPSDAALARKTLTPLLNAPLDIPTLQEHLTQLSGLDRYQTMNWQTIGGTGKEGLLVRGREAVTRHRF